MILWLILAIVAFCVFVTAGWLIGLFNTMVTARQDLREMWSNIKTEYQRRADLILNLVETAKGSMKFERDTLREVTQARAGYFGSTKTDEIKNLGKLNTLFANLMGRFEAYPKLGSLKAMETVMEELRTTENRINIARTDYNETVRDYHVLIHSFPATLMAENFGFLDEQFFEEEPGAAKAPKISMRDFAVDPNPARNTAKKATKKGGKKKRRV